MNRWRREGKGIEKVGKRGWRGKERVLIERELTGWNKKGSCKEKGD